MGEVTEDWPNEDRDDPSEPVDIAATELNSEGNSKLRFNAGDDLSRTRFRRSTQNISPYVTLCGARC